MKLSKRTISNCRKARHTMQESAEVYGYETGRVEYEKPYMDGWNAGYNYQKGMQSAATKAATSLVSNAAADALAAVVIFSLLKIISTAQDKFGKKDNDEDDEVVVDFVPGDN